MTWIKTVPFDKGDEELMRYILAVRENYPAEYAEPVPAADADEPGGIVGSHSLIPEALYHAFSTFGVLMSSGLPLGRSQHEMIATVVSALNRCHY